MISILRSQHNDCCLLFTLFRLKGGKRLERAQYQTSQPCKLGKGCPAYRLEMSGWVGSVTVREPDSEFALLLSFLIHRGQTWERIVAEDHK